MTIQFAILVQHLLLASIALLLLFLIGLIVRRLVLRDAVVQYRFQSVLVVAASLVLPMQFLCCEIFIDPQRETAFANRHDSVVWSDPALFHQYDAMQILPESMGTVPEHDRVSHGSFQSKSAQSTRGNGPNFPVNGQLAEQPPVEIDSASRFGDTVQEIIRHPVSRWISISYLLGVAFLLGLLCLRVWKTSRLVHKSIPVNDQRLIAIARETIGSRVSLRTSSMVTSPACLMFPVRLILFPSSQASQLNDEQLRCILCHEDVHMKRRDWIVCGFERLLLILMWFHPLAWRMTCRNGQDRECSCDALVVRRTEKPKTYASAMLDCCLPSSQSNIALVTSFNSVKTMKTVKRRLEMLSFANQTSSPLSVAVTATLFLLLSVFGGLLHATLVSTVAPESVWSSQVTTPATARSGNHSIDPTVDSDNDGLTDFHETHKYLTSPNKADSDGDGIPDGDWRERREYQYTVRSVVQVLRPVTIEYLNDHFQDARILDETDSYVELEVVHYPFNRVASSITANENWHDAAASQEQWVQPGPSSDWTPQMQEQLKRELKEDGIDVETMSDREIVEKVSKWLCERAEYVDGFTTFVTAWDESGKPYIPEGLDGAAERELAKSGLTIEQQWRREVSASGMFEHKRRGSCTSSAIYLNGCLKALGIPTRTVLCIPLIDASDYREFDLVMNIEHAAVRQHLLRSLRPLEQSWASHTFNEVFVGGNWHRLNYSNLGQGIYDRQLFGMITHVGTFNDWADARAHETIGKRQKTDGPKDVFGFRNPYSTISLRDEIGIHCKVELPEIQEEGGHVVEKIYWTDDEELPEDIRNNCRDRGRFGLIADVSGVEGMQELLGFMETADLRVYMNPQGEDDHPQLKIGFVKGCFWINNDRAYIYVPFGGGDKRDLVKNVEYVFQPRASSVEKGWQVREELKATRTKDFPR